MNRAMNLENAKRIELFLPTGNAQGVCEVTTVAPPVRAVRTPRAELSSAKGLVEVESPGLYFLFEETYNAGEKQRVYIGESTDCYQRLSKHKSDKEFWDTAIMFMSYVQEDITLDQQKYMEHKAIREAKKIGRFEVVNKNEPKKKNITLGRKSDFSKIMESIKSILSVLNFKVLEPIEEEGTIVNIDYKNLNAKGSYKNGELTVFEGSELDKDITNSFRKTYMEKRKNLQDKGVITEKGGVLVFEEDYPFDSPSEAANILCGARLNGWKHWVGSDGKSLDELDN